MSIDYKLIGQTDVCICPDCSAKRKQLKALIKSPDTVITLDLYREACQYEVNCRAPANASLLDTLVAMS